MSSQQQQLRIQSNSYYCQQTNSPSIKLSITYPQISNLSYNFEMTLDISIQKLLPRISYQHVRTLSIYMAKREIVLNNLLQKTMYRIIVKVVKNKNNSDNSNRGLNQQKKVFVFTQGKPQREDNDNNIQYQQQQQEQQSYSEVVKQNIKNYFNQYHHNNQLEQQQNNLPSKYQPINRRPASNNRPQQQTILSSSSSIRSKPTSTVSSFINTTKNNYNKQNIHNKNTFNNNKNTFNNNKNNFTNSQTLIKVIAQNDPLINNKKIQKYILQARTSSSTKNYLQTKNYQCFNHMNSKYKNQKQRRQHLQKTLLVTKAIDMFGDIYQADVQSGVIDVNNNKTGKEFFKNDWFMGPFYSYDVNQQQMKANKNRMNRRNNTNQQED